MDGSIWVVIWLILELELVKTSQGLSGLKGTYLGLSGLVLTPFSGYFLPTQCINCVNTLINKSTASTVLYSPLWSKY